MKRESTEDRSEQRPETGVAPEQESKRGKEGGAVTPGNYGRQLGAMIATKTGDSLVNAKTVLAWLMSSLGVPVAMIAWLVPLRESLSMLPQFWIAGQIRRLRRRKTVWITGALLQMVSVGAMGLTALLLTGVSAGWAILGCLVAFSLARALCSISSKDVLGKTIPKGKRGRITGLSSSISGITTLAVGGGILFGLQGVEDATWFVVPLWGAAGLWLLATLLYSGIKEEDGEVSEGAGSFRESLKSLVLLKEDAPFRRFVMARALMLCSALNAPFLIVLAREAGQSGANMLGAFVLAGGLASAVSGGGWGWFADRSSRRVVQVAGGCAALVGVAVAGAEWVDWSVMKGAWAYPVAFFLLSVAHNGVRVGRKTYIVDLAGGNKRTGYVAVSNTVIGAVLLLTGSVGVLSTFLPPEGIVFLLSLVGMGGVLMAGALPEA